MKAERIIIHLALIVLSLVPGLQKITGDFPPEWFKQKFEGSLLDLFEGSITLSYTIITVIELALAFLIITSLMFMLIQKKNHLLAMALNGFLILFFLLFFGNFIVSDYHSGFEDFVYFITIIICKQRLLKPDPIFS